MVFVGTLTIISFMDILCGQINVLSPQLEQYFTSEQSLQLVPFELICMAQAHLENTRS
jgi:hypothetical protein